MPSATTSEQSIRQLQRVIDTRFATLFRSTPHELAPLSPMPRENPKSFAPQNRSMAHEAAALPPIRESKSPKRSFQAASVAQRDVQSAAPPLRSALRKPREAYVAVLRSNSSMPVAALASTDSVLVPRDHASETSEHIKYMLDLEGVSSEDIIVELHKHKLWVRGPKTNTRVDQNERFASAERGSGQFSRIIDVPYGVIDVHAKCVDGVLYVTLNKPGEPAFITAASRSTNRSNSTKRIVTF